LLDRFNDRDWAETCQIGPKGGIVLTRLTGAKSPRSASGKTIDFSLGRGI